MRRTPTRRRTGTALIEFAFVVPVLFLILLGIFEYARLLFTWQLLHNAAREGARYAVVSVETATTAQVRAYVNEYLAGQGATAFVGYSPSSNITVFLADPATGAPTAEPWTDSGWGDLVGVTVSGTYTPVVPGFLRLTGSFTLSGTCVMTTEAN
ncbi:MAG: TadE/TadG family type IV pilus assembly protein [Gemmataceae bacterium]